MKQLQNNFTTPEQSKRLLELGMPADSADMYYFTQDSDIPLYQLRNGVPLYPCWSAGRLIEIYVIARGVDTAYFPIERNEDMIKYLIRLYKEKVTDLNFSKLED